MPEIETPEATWTRDGFRDDDECPGALVAKTSEAYHGFEITMWPPGVTGGWSEPQPVTTYDVDLGLEHIAYRNSRAEARKQLTALIAEAQQALALLDTAPDPTTQKD